MDLETFVCKISALTLNTKDFKHKKAENMLINKKQLPIQFSSGNHYVTLQILCQFRRTILLMPEQVKIDK